MTQPQLCYHLTLNDLIQYIEQFPSKKPALIHNLYPLGQQTPTQVQTPLGEIGIPKLIGLSQIITYPTYLNLINQNLKKLIDQHRYRKVNHITNELMHNAALIDKTSQLFDVNTGQTITNTQLITNLRTTFY